MVGQNALDLFDFAPRESVIFSNLRRSSRTLQIEYRFTTSADHMHMRWPMIVRVNHHPQSLEPKNCRHSLLYPKRLGLWNQLIPDPKTLNSSASSPSSACTGC